MSATIATDQVSEEDRILKLLQDQTSEHQKHLTEEEKLFDNLSVKSKLKKLQDLVKRSQVFSSIISDTLLESSINVNNKTAVDNSENKENAIELPSKKRKKIAVQPKITDMMIKKKLDSQKEEPILRQVKHHKQPKMVKNCVMKDYQIEGMDWLVTLYQNGLNGILADEMGLGKTLQSIALLSYLFEQGIRGPFLICCPLSTVSNWMSEFERFAPDLKVIDYIGLKENRIKMRPKLKNYDVVIVSFEISIIDFKYLKPIWWSYLIVDEGHRLKNTNCLLIRQLKRLNVANRLLLTGTPLQNNLNELWSLLNFILPEIFHDIDMFQQWFDFSALESLKDENEELNELINVEIQKSLIANLHTILKPFLLRRLKKDVIKGLPPKREYIIYSKLAPEQESLYNATLSKNLYSVLMSQSFRQYLSANHLIKNKRRCNQAHIDNFIKLQQSNGTYSDESKFDPILSPHWQFVESQLRHKKLQNPLMQLRLICNTPHCFFYPWNNGQPDNELINQSSKLQILNQLIPRLFQDNKKRKILIFSQFTGTLDIVEQFLTDFLDLKTCRIDGSTDQLDRKEQIKSFNNVNDVDSADVFLLSTRAGGLGINLTAADTVILFDSDWNPQVDLQAMDRVHRIGQTKPVIVYRLVTKNTIEEVVLAKADSKRRLEKLVIELGKFESLISYGGKGKKNDDDMLTSLQKFLTAKEFKLSGADQDVTDNVLSEEELKELLDRSDAAYVSDRDVNGGGLLQHVSLFETVSSFE